MCIFPSGNATAGWTTTTFSNTIVQFKQKRYLSRATDIFSTIFTGTFGMQGTSTWLTHTIVLLVFLPVSHTALLFRFIQLLLELFYLFIKFLFLFFLFFDYFPFFLRCHHLFGSGKCVFRIVKNLLFSS